MSVTLDRTLHKALYLLFNEGYHGSSAEFAVRTELCHEAMRLAAVVLEHPLGATPTTYALSAPARTHRCLGQPELTF
jgi:RNA polymerase sigma-70 factor (ECF subfamily)